MWSQPLIFWIGVSHPGHAFKPNLTNPSTCALSSSAFQLGLRSRSYSAQVLSSCHGMSCIAQLLNPQLLHRKIGPSAPDSCSCPEPQGEEVGARHHLKLGREPRAA